MSRTNRMAPFLDQRDVVLRSLPSSRPAKRQNRKRHHNNGRNKKQKKFICTYSGCSESFGYDSLLKRHEQGHLGIKPFSCKWNGCRYFATQRAGVFTHIRMKHFKLPRVQKNQNFADDRDPNQFIEVDQELLARRLT